MTKNSILLLILYCSLTIGAGIASAVEIQTGPVDQNLTSTSAGEKQPATIGPRDPEKEKPQGVGVDFFVNRNLAVTSSVSLVSQEPYLQSGAVNSGGLGLSASQLGGAVGLKIFFN